MYLLWEKNEEEFKVESHETTSHFSSLDCLQEGCTKNAKEALCK
jgi:hypothetical protein